MKRQKRKGLSARYRNENADNTQSVDGGFFDDTKEGKDKSLYYVVESPFEIPKLFQTGKYPRLISNYLKNSDKKPFICDWTDSIESNQNAALREITILRRNGRIPKIDYKVRFLKEFFADEINAHRKNIFEVMRNVRLQERLNVRCPISLEAVVALELTRGEDDKPNNRVHFHFLTKDPRSPEELTKVFITACEYSGLVKNEDFVVDKPRPLWDGYTYFNYFTKFEYLDKLFLFKKGTGLQKIYTIGKWFTKKKSELWTEGDNRDQPAKDDTDNTDDKL